MDRIRLVLCLFFTMFVQIGYINAQTINLNQFGIEEGLPQSSIYTMVHDKDGNIWVGTMAGISKYNGLQFENFTKKNGLAQNRVISSCIDKDGNIWFGHWAGGITKYDSKTKVFTEIVPEGINLVKQITCIYQDASGIMWFGTDGAGLLKFTNGKFEELSKSAGLPSESIFSIAENKNKELLVATNNGLAVISSSGSVSIKKGIPSSSIKSLLFDNKNNLWIGTADKGLIKLSENGSVTIYDTKKGLPSNNVSVIYQDVNGTIFIGTNGGGFAKFLDRLEANGYKGNLFQKINTENGLSSDKVLSIIQDRERNIWIGTSLNLNQYFDEQFEMYGINEGLDNSLIWAVAQSKDGNYWLGTEGGVVKFIKGENTNESKFVNYTGKKSEVQNIVSLYEDVQGNVWFSNFGEGISYLDPSSKKVTTLTEKDGVSAKEIYFVTGDNNNGIWFASNGNGIYRYDLKTKSVRNYTTKDGLGSDKVYSIFCDSKNNVWLGSLAGDLTVYDGKSFKKFTDKEGYSSRFTISFTEDAAGNIWIGTFDNGVYKYDGKSFKNYSSKDGLSSDSPFLLLADNKNNLWIGSGLGIDKFNLKEETIKHYGRYDGFLGVEINPNAACKDKDGNLWFGTIIGLVKYKSDNEKNNNVEPITSIKNPRINFKEVEIPENKSFSYFDNHITFDFVGTSLTNPKRVRYKYMLEGQDNEWSPVVKDNYVTYPDLDPGTYTFKVMSANNDGVWNKEPVSYSFTVRPPFWKTWWFWTIVLVVVVVAVISYIKYREKKLRQENIILENKVTERTEEINLQKVELER
ncbi:MAG: hypothetical protein J0M08_13820, partial [Bacteroidetes bacterium]|nr:hypothetical protein [Bacteroidota bacterium]